MPQWDVFWEPLEGTIADSYNVYLRERSGEWTLLGSTPGNRWRFDVPDVVTPYQVAIAAVVNQIEAPEDTWETHDFMPSSDADIELPSDPGPFVVEQIDQSFDVRARWQAVDFVHLAAYEIREGSDWETGLVRLIVPAGVPRTQDGWIEAGFGMLAPKSTTYRMKTFSTQGDYSENEVTWTIDIQAPNTYKPETPTDEKAGGFAGTQDDTEVSGGNLQLSLQPTTAAGRTANADTYTKPQWLPHYGTGAYTTEVMEALDDAAAGIVADEVITIDIEGSKVAAVSFFADQRRAIMRPRYDANGVIRDPEAIGPYDYVYANETVKYGNEIAIEIRTTLDNPAGSPTWTNWRPFVPGARYRYRGVQLRFTITCRWSWSWRFTKMTFTRWRRNLKDEVVVEDSTGSGGQPVTFSEPFTKAPVVQVTVKGTTAKYATWDNVTRTGCDIYIWDDGDPATQVTGTVGVTAAGV